MERRGRFVNSKRELSIDVVHEQLRNTIYEQSISPEGTDKNKNFENFDFAHKFKASPEHSIGRFTKTNLRKMGDITDKVR